MNSSASSLLLVDGGIGFSSFIPSKFPTSLHSCLELLVDSLTLVIMYFLLLNSSNLLCLFCSLVNALQ